MQSPLRRFAAGTGNRGLILLGALGAINILLWIVTWKASHRYAFLLGHRHLSLLTAGAAWLAYGYGLRHAVDADHISAIDNTTRRLMQRGQKPIGVGLFFSLGHSSVVILLCAGLALATGYVQRHLPQWERAGSLAGTCVSTAFLYGIGILNLILLIDLARSYRRMRAGEAAESSDDTLPSGLLGRLLRPLLALVSRSWQMYFIGFLFGLGFDTATEIGVLALSARSGQAGVPFWAILLLPLLFTAAMSLVDTLDGLLMLGAYGWAYLEPSRKLLYNVGITALSVAVAFAVGTSELLQALTSSAWIRGPLAAFADRIPLDNAGYYIVGLFAALWALSWTIGRLRRGADAQA
jgi:high-affinity nickel-transport protein